MNENRHAVVHDGVVTNIIVTNEDTPEGWTAEYAESIGAIIDDLPEGSEVGIGWMRSKSGRYKAPPAPPPVEEE